MKLHLVVALMLPLALPAAPRFTAKTTTDHGVQIVRLEDAADGVEVSIIPSYGNRAYELKVHGKNLLYFPTDPGALKAATKRSFNGIPFLAPWGNRIPGGGFWANDKRYMFNPSLGNLSMSPNNVAIHGMLTASPLWEVADVSASETSAHVTSRLQFWRYPALMANWPFAHEYEMTYTLTRLGLEVTTTIKNMAAEPMPVVIGFHPYFQIPGIARSECQAHIAARKHVEMDSELVATGSLTASQLDDNVSLKTRTFDDGYTDLIRDSDGRARFSLSGGGKKIEVLFGPKYQAAIVFAPPKQDFLCFEPMAAITNGINLAHEGKYSDLQTVAPGAQWKESFWIQFSGF